MDSAFETEVRVEPTSLPKKPHPRPNPLDCKGKGRTLWWIDPVKTTSNGPFRWESAPKGVAVGLGSVWVANPVSGTVYRINPSSGRVIKRIEVAPHVGAITVAGGTVWVGVR